MVITVVTIKVIAIMHEVSVCHMFLRSASKIVIIVIVNISRVIGDIMLVYTTHAMFIV